MCLLGDAERKNAVEMIVRALKFLRLSYPALRDCHLAAYVDNALVGITIGGRVSHLLATPEQAKNAQTAILNLLTDNDKRIIGHGRSDVRDLAV